MDMPGATATLHITPMITRTVAVSMRRAAGASAPVEESPRPPPSWLAVVLVAAPARPPPEPAEPAARASSAAAARVPDAGALAARHRHHRRERKTSVNWCPAACCEFEAVVNSKL